ncbi:putative 1-acyl-sn-glycerol-3-phosphate acyltransferase 5 isoform X1 [Canna indica]|uniref:1-acylglycerol-3-phosphate O-acyltransferase n=1 Tax=Canna indica TaxID=4628 RepID=A0AAQ3KR85_9LILI|nr:putative 1-acyl-sn-glycerol-3-phosphate acyltransferase 5 isoform X1 [Canna indica]
MISEYKMSNMNDCTSIKGESLSGNKKENISAPLRLKDQLSHRPLTAMRALRGIVCLIILLSTAFMMIVYWAPVTTLLLRLFSVHYSRKATSFLFAIWLSLWPFLFEKINKTKVVFSGEIVHREERVLLFANHRTEVDWMYLWDLALRKGQLGYLKYILKSSLMKLPIFGWGFHILEFIAVERKWEIDESTMREKLSSFKDPHDPLWLVVFPEGTDYTEKKCIKSQQFAAENGLPILKNSLLPKTKGFFACLEALRNSLDAVYDVTIGYKHRCPTLIDNVFGVDPSEVHIHVQRVLLDEIPISENEAAKWLVERFRLKDELLSGFTTLGYFPNEGTDSDISTLMCLAKCFVILVLTSFFIYLTLFSSFWFKIYVAFSCSYISFATYFNILPSPLFGSAKAWFNAKRKVL